MRKINPQPWLISDEKWKSYSDDKKFEIIEKVRANEKLLRDQKEKLHKGKYFPNIPQKRYGYVANKGIHSSNS